MIGYNITKNEMKSRGVNELAPMDYSFAMLVAIGVDETQAYMTTIRGRDYEKKEESQISKFRDKCEKEAEELLQRPDIKTCVDFLKNEFEKTVKDEALELSDVNFSAEDLRRILAKFLKTKYDDLDSADAKDLLNAIKIYIDKFGDIGDDGIAKFNRHFIQVYPPYNAVCPSCNREIDLPRGVNSKCKHCGHRFVWNEEKERYFS